MTRDSKEVVQLRAQIEAAARKGYSFEAVELKIAASLLEQGSVRGQLDVKELTCIIRNVVYTRFANQSICGRNLDLVHNIPVSDVLVPTK